MNTSIFEVENWREIGATLSRNKTRTFLTAFGIFWGTAMLAMLLGGSFGFEGIMSRNFAGFATNLGAVIPDQRTLSYHGFNKGTTWQLMQSDIDLIRQSAPAIEHSSAIISLYLETTYGSKSRNTRILGVESGYAAIMEPILYEGRFINESDIAGRRKNAVIGKNLASTLFGDESPIGKFIIIGNLHFQVIGVAGQKSQASIAGRIDDSLVIPSSVARNSLSGGDNSWGFFVYTAPSGKKPSDNEATIRRIVSRAHSIHPDDENAISFMDISEQFEMIDNIFLGVNLLALFVGLGSLMAGVIGVGNIMWIVVKERTHEFGIRRALGAKPSDITVQVLSESILLTLVAGTAGVCFGALVLGIVDHATVDPLLGKAGFELPFKLAVGIVLTFIVLGTLAGTLPAMRAMKIKPIEALNDK